MKKERFYIDEYAPINAWYMIPLSKKDEFINLRDSLLNLKGLSVKKSFMEDEEFLSKILDSEFSRYRIDFPDCISFENPKNV